MPRAVSRRLLGFIVALLLALALLPGTTASAAGKVKPVPLSGWGYNNDGELGTGDFPGPIDTSGVLAGKTISAVSSGQDHSCVIADGAPYCWGRNGYGQLGNNTTNDSSSPVAVDTSGVLSGLTVTAIAADGRHTCVVAGSASATPAAFCWGANNYGQLGNGTQTNSSVPVAVDSSGVLSGKTVTQISTNSSSAAGASCAIADDRAYCWGYNGNGNLGNDANSPTVNPSPVAVVTNSGLGSQAVTSIAQGRAHTCAVAGGQVYCWGANNEGQIGIGNNTTFPFHPTAVDTSGVLSGKTVTYVSAGEDSTCVVASGAGYCWGGNAMGQLGDGTISQAINPVAIYAGGVLAKKTMTRIDVRFDHGCAIASGAGYCWGDNTRGQLGDGTTEPRAFPVAVTTSGALSRKTLTSIGVGQSFTCAGDGSMTYCWGYNSFGELGRGTNSYAVSTPVAVYTGGVLAKKTVTAGDAGAYHSCVIARKVPYCWGYNSYGELGDNTYIDRHVPVRVDTTGALTGKSVTAISGGYYHTCAIANGAAYCWGYGSTGELGDGNQTDSLIPVAVDTSGVLAGKTITAISAGYDHSCAIAGGAAYCWGNNSSGQLGDGTFDAAASPVAVKADGALTGKTVTAIEAGDGNTCVIANGQAYCWGSNGYGQVGNDTNTDQNAPVAVLGPLNGATVTAISTGDLTTCAIKSGAAYCWGYGDYGQLGNQTTTGSNLPVAVYTGGVLSGKTVTAISAGGLFTCVLADGAPYCWGYNYYGSLGDGTVTDSTEPVAVDTSGILAGRTPTVISSGGSHVLLR